LTKQFECALEGWHSQRCLPGQDASASGLKIKEGSAWSTASRSGLRELLKELASASILALIEGEVSFLQNRRDILRQRLTDVTTEGAAH
jgi:hypothetical protein